METQTQWNQLLGSENWEGLLDPLDLHLRRLILRCGDFCQATYDAFNNDTNSKYCGSSRYGKKSFFEKVALDSASDYEVAAFLYGTARVSVPEAFLLHAQSRESWDRESNWIGYIAVTTDEVSAKLGRREIYIVWRGTTRNYEWIDVLGAKLQSIEELSATDPIVTNGDSSKDSNVTNGDRVEDTKGRARAKASPKFVKILSKLLEICAKTTNGDDDDDEDDKKTPKVMRGWLTMYTSDDPKSSFTKTSVRTQIVTKLKELMIKYKGEEVSITMVGHSLGASLSVLCAYDLAENGFTNIPISAFVFGLPQVGNKAFNEKLKKFTNVHVLHIRNTIDIIPHYPSKLMGYVFTGTELLIDTRKSPSLKDSKNPSDWHNLQAMLHIVAGWNGENGDFELKVKRSLALVNKSSGFLKDECMVPGSWWVEKNKGMVLDESGEWGMAAPSDEDLPVPEF